MIIPFCSELHCVYSQSSQKLEIRKKERVLTWIRWGYTDRQQGDLIIVLTWIRWGYTDIQLGDLIIVLTWIRWWYTDRQLGDLISLVTWIRWGYTDRQQGDLIRVLTWIRWGYTDRQQGDLIRVLTWIRWGYTAKQQGDLIRVLTWIRWGYADRQQGDLIRVLTWIRWRYTGRQLGDLIRVLTWIRWGYTDRQQGRAGNRTQASGSVANNSDHQTTEAVILQVIQCVFWNKSSHKGNLEHNYSGDLATLAVLMSINRNFTVKALFKNYKKTRSWNSEPPLASWSHSYMCCCVCSCPPAQPASPHVLKLWTEITLPYFGPGLL
jgi:hypothetical protein